MAERSDNAGSAPASARLSVDVAIIGAGMGGAAAATVLGRAGHRVALIDRHQTYPPEFRAEKITGSQVRLLKNVGIADAVIGVATPYDDIISARRGRIIDRKSIQEYGAPYQTMVNAARGEIPGNVQFMLGIVTGLSTSESTQEVRLSDGRTVEARLVILASGINGSLVEELGIGHRFAHKGHTLCIGFTIEPVGREAFDFTALTYYGQGVKDKIDYISFFPMDGAMRANMFSFHSLNDEWSLGMRDAPRETLLKTLPELKNFLGDFKVTDKSKLRSIDLRFANNYRRPGIVLVGDAFQTSCPAAGTGLTRALTDVDRLCNVYVPLWLQSPGMAAWKIAQFYDDPVKKECDAHAYHIANYRRAFTIDTSAPWELRRRLIFPMRRATDVLRRLSQSALRMTASLRGGFVSGARP